MSPPRAVAILALAVLLAATTAFAGFDEAVMRYEGGDFRGAAAHAESMIKRGQDSGRLRTLLG